MNSCAVGDRDGDALERFDCQTDTRKHGSHLEIFELSGRLQSEGIKCAKVMTVRVEGVPILAHAQRFSCLPVWRR